MSRYVNFYSGITPLFNHIQNPGNAIKVFLYLIERHVCYVAEIVRNEGALANTDQAASIPVAGGPGRTWIPDIVVT